MSVNANSKLRRSSANVVLAFALLAALCFLSWHSARAGYAALLTANAPLTRDLHAANQAVGLSPNNPRTHLVLGALLEANDDRAAAIRHYQTAVKLRPGDYVLWMQLARGQELNGDTAGAINSATVALGLAPSYAQPHWQLGNILVRAGRVDGGFSELRSASKSDPTLLPGVIDLAWQMSEGKVSYVIAAIQPGTPNTYKALADYFRKRGEARPAIDMLAAAGDGAKQERSAYVAELIAVRKFPDAFRLWSIEHPTDPDGPPLFDAGFEEEADLDQPGFGWRAAQRTPALTLSLDNSNPHAGRTSLRVDFEGESSANAPIISQLRLLGSKSNYQLNVFFRTEKLVSGGLPTILILDAGNNKILGQTDALPQSTDGWRSVTVDFTTGEATSAVQIALQRKPCPAEQCPIFGKLWLDSFSLRGPGF